MEVYLCEKPSQAKDLARVLNVSGKSNGYIGSGDKRVTWAYGHLFELFMPEDYDPELKNWSLSTLPLIPDPWKLSLKRSGSKQYKVIKQLVDAATIVYIATDYDREGESIARQILERTRYQGPIKRVCLAALDDASINTALRNCKQGNETLPLYFEAISRQRADWLVGMNFSRLYSVLAREYRVRLTFQVGRVLTPTVTLVVQRDREIASFRPSPYYLLDCPVAVQNGHFIARWMPDEAYSDSHGRCTNKSYAEQAAAAVQGQPGQITRAEIKQAKGSAPLPFDQTSLQQYANQRWGYSSAQVMEASQALYEKHKATTYPRTECRYLPESTLQDARAKLKALADSDPNFAGPVAGADPSLKSRAFDDKKVAPPHDGIVPTGATVEISKMSEVEFNIYDAIRRRYVAQFYQPARFTKAHIQVHCAGHHFEAKGRTPVSPGWKVLFDDDINEDVVDNPDQDGELPPQNRLPSVSQGEPAQIGKTEISDKITRPPAHFTESTLLGAMKNVARFVQEPAFKNILKETAGLGTSATRDSIIEGAVNKGYLKRTKRTLTATDKAYTLDTLLPEIIKSPGMTAAWEQELNAIGRGESSSTQFYQQITDWISQTVDVITTEFSANSAEVKAALQKAAGPVQACPKCGTEGLQRRKGKHGFYWPCQACNTNFKDNRGKPVDKDQEAANNPPCPVCGAQTRLRTSKQKSKGSRKFYGCINYPQCKGTVATKSPTRRKRS